MKNKIKFENHYRISQADIIAIDTLIEYLQYGVMILLKNKPLQSPNEDSIALDEYEAHLEKVYSFAEKIFSKKNDYF